MNQTPDIITQTKEDWRELGFFYVFEEEEKRWILRGSIKGLSAFVQILREYSRKVLNNKVGEHDHFGPYMYLTLVTWVSPRITDYGIHGTLSDLAGLADIVERQLSITKPGDLLIVDTEYSTENEATLVLKVEADGFDPADADDFAWANK